MKNSLIYREQDFLWQTKKSKNAKYFNGFSKTFEIVAWGKITAVEIHNT